ncbi:hypothetical protein C8R43DRAFT_1177520 [Mycena crocata]|nr:hypothetical protein C8R43DRAFT_1177520 [Mycena crocata]
MAHLSISGHTLIQLPLPSGLAATIPYEGYRPAGGGGAGSSQRHEPPTVFVSIDETKLHGLIADSKVQEALDVLHPVVSVEAGHILATEADVERAAHVYLLHDVNKIIQDYLDFEFGAGVKTLVCNSQATEHSARTDTSWSIDGRTILVLEAKKCRTILESDWTPHILSLRLPPNCDLTTRAALITAAAQERVNTHFEGFASTESDNHIQLGKQAVMYNVTHKAPVVLLFDWLGMILLDFQPDTKEDNIPDASDATWNDERRPVEILISDESTGWTHKHLLLAALLLGMEKDPREPSSDTSF